MQSPFAFIRRWCVTLICWAAVAAGAALCARQFGSPLAWGVWTGVAALLCVGGVLLIKSQPMGKATIAGRIGYQVAHFGFRAGQGTLFAVAWISWLVWVVVGSAVIWMTADGWQPMRTAMAAAWTVDVLAIFYVVGIQLANRPRRIEGVHTPMRLPQSVQKLVGVGMALVSVSLVLWWVPGTPAAQLAALTMAAAPIVVLGGGFGVFMLIVMTVGKNVRWN